MPQAWLGARYLRRGSLDARRWMHRWQVGLSAIGRHSTPLPLVDAMRTSTVPKRTSPLGAVQSSIGDPTLMMSTVWVRFRQAGFHCWPEAPEAQAYLRDRHRHLFHVEVSVMSGVDNARSIEFHRLLEHAKTIMRDVALRGKMYDYGHASCESIAASMALRLCRVYSTVVTVTISEDGECGSTVTAGPS